MSARLAADNLPLESVTKDLHLRYGLDFIIDGVPAQEKASVHAAGTLREVLDRVAQAYGYSWKLSSSGTVLMTKSFTLSGDLPQAHAGEIRRVAGAR